MEEKKEVTHSLHLEQRGHGLITGVTEMKSFDEENIFMETSQGTLAIRGSSLHVCRLELEKGEAEIEGKVDSLIYTQGRKEKKKPKLRSEKEQNYISNAKMMLMQRNHLSEDEAYRYIQKSSMDSGTNMVETAQMLLMLLYES